MTAPATPPAPTPPVVLADYRCYRCNIDFRAPASSGPSEACPLCGSAERTTPIDSASARTESLPAPE